MKQDIHPEYKEIIFLDMSSGKKFLCRSTAKTSEEVEFEGKKYPCMKISISSDSHPFYTGDQTFVDTEGRVDKFRKRYERKAEVQADSKKEEESSHSKKSDASKEKKAGPKKSGAKEAGK